MRQKLLFQGPRGPLWDLQKGLVEGCLALAFNPAPCAWCWILMETSWSGCEGEGFSLSEGHPALLPYALHALGRIFHVLLRQACH